jgi:hypothetical protein
MVAKKIERVGMRAVSCMMDNTFLKIIKDKLKELQ